MPYSSNEELPNSVRGAIPNEPGQTLFRRVFNSTLARTDDEPRAMATAWAALKEAGYEKNEEDVWVKKSNGGRTLYACRELTNGEELIAWAQAAGIPNLKSPDELHVTTAYSQRPILWASDRHPLMMEPAGVVAIPAGPKPLDVFGRDARYLVITFDSPELTNEWLYYRETGASWDLPGYTPHVTLTDALPDDFDIGDLVMDHFYGEIVLGAARHEEIDQSKVAKSDPGLGDVHVPTTRRPEDEDEELDKAEATFEPPEAARNAARRALRWREEHGDEVKGGTRVGWTRARQLADGDKLSRDVVSRMAQFNRHRKNSKVDPKHKDEPWKDNGHVAWLIWGGDAGVDWAMREMDRLQKYQVGDHRYTMRREAEAAAPTLGLTGAHPYESPEGEIHFMPGETHEAYVAAMSQQRSAKTVAELVADHLKGLIGVFSGEVEVELSVEGKILKADSEQRMVWGWASVITDQNGPVVDQQGDVIHADEMVKFTTDFMLGDARIGKRMHDGPPVGEVVHSLPITFELAKSLGIATPREGWIVAMKVHDDEVWADVKKGKLGAFSIGGAAHREIME